MGTTRYPSLVWGTTRKPLLIDLLDTVAGALESFTAATVTMWTVDGVQVPGVIAAAASIAVPTVPAWAQIWDDGSGLGIPEPLTGPVTYYVDWLLTSAGGVYPVPLRFEWTVLPRNPALR